MGRPHREISPTGIYHVMVRGVNKQRIFENIEDYNGFIRILHKCLHTDTEGTELKEPNFDIYSYCFMDNHVHLLIGTREISLSDIIKRIMSSYARFFNYRYHRVGHLFQDRYRSEVCTNDGYFFTLLTYIHRNPIEAGICQYPDQYIFSSFNEITQSCQTPLCNLSNIQEHIGYIKPKDIKDWLIQMNIDLHHNIYQPGQAARENIKAEYTQLSELATQKDIETNSSSLPTSERRTLQPGLDTLPPSLKFTQWCQTLLCNLHQAFLNKTDADTLDRLILDTLLGLSATTSITDFQRLDKKTMRNALAQVRDAGISIRHLSRISGISEGIIRYCKNPDNYTMVSGTNV